MPKRRPDLGPCRCPFHLTDPAQAGYVSWDRLGEAARSYPHLKPCGKEEWNWIDRSECIDMILQTEHLCIC